MPNNYVHPFATQEMNTSQEYATLIAELNREVSTHHPQDIVQFCADFFTQRLSQERQQSRSLTFTQGILIKRFSKLLLLDCFFFLFDR